jgi:hypothetical protein
MVEDLRAAGHSLKDIWGYTLRQMDAFIKLAKGREKDRLFDLASVTRMAYHADDDGWKDFTKSMS